MLNGDNRFFLSIPSGDYLRMTDRWILPKYPFGGLRQNDSIFIVAEEFASHTSMENTVSGKIPPNDFKNLFHRCLDCGDGGGIDYIIHAAAAREVVAGLI